MANEMVKINEKRLFSWEIFKQTFKQNGILWFLFTAVLIVMSSAIIAVFDAQMMSGIQDFIKDSPFAEMMEDDEMGAFTSIVGLLSSSIYKMQGIIISLIFVIMTANTLVASKVDQGSMAYLLSTPIKRATVIRTQALYLITSVVLMFGLLTGSGILAVQGFHGGVWSVAYPKDVTEAAEILDMTPEEIDANPQLILDNDEAFEKGAEVRAIDEDVYKAYLELRINPDGDDSMSMPDFADLIPELPAGVDPAQIPGITDEMLQMIKLAQQMQNLNSSEAAALIQSKFMTAISAGAEVLGIEASDLSDDLSKLKGNSAAMEKASEESGLPESMLISSINAQAAQKQVQIDEGAEFDVAAYLRLNLGAFLLLLAISGISFMFSCIFNRTKYSLALGAGLPVAFFILELMSETGESLEFLKYLSINTFFVPSDVTGGGDFWPGFIALGCIAVVTYITGLEWFRRKDLPL